jgi:hypothetical protein
MTTQLSDDELKVLRPFALRGTAPHVIAETQGVSLTYVEEILDRLAALDRTVAKQVLADHDGSSSNLPSQESSKRSPSPKTKPTKTTTTTSPDGISALLDQATTSALPSVQALAAQIRELVRDLTEQLQDETTAAKEVHQWVDARIGTLKAQVAALNAECDRLTKHGVDELAVRDWAKAEGIEVPNVGRVSWFTIRAYLVAQLEREKSGRSQQD